MGAKSRSFLRLLDARQVGMTTQCDRMHLHSALVLPDYVVCTLLFAAVMLTVQIKVLSTHPVELIDCRVKPVAAPLAYGHASCSFQSAWLELCTY